MSSIDSILIPPGADFAARAVGVGRAFLRRQWRDGGAVGMQPVVLVPMAAQISGIRGAWIEALGGAPELLPRFLTPGHWLLDLPPDGSAPRHAIARLLEVQQALKANAWVREVLGARSEAGLWGLAQALVGLCDELSETWLPQGAATDASASAASPVASSAALEARLAQALESVYAHLHRRVLGEEAQLVLTFWKLLTGADDPVPSRMRAFRRLAQTAHAPVVWIAPLRSSAPEEQFIAALSARVPVCVVRQAWVPARARAQDDSADGLGAWGLGEVPTETPAETRTGMPTAMPTGVRAGIGAGVGAGTRNATRVSMSVWTRIAEAWPECLEAPPAAASDCATATAEPGIDSELAPPAAQDSQLRIVAAQRFEDEAIVAASQLIEWLNDGATHLALVAQDRIVARRTRALLARAGIPVRDETGWKLSTTRAAAAVMRWFDIAASGSGGSSGNGAPTGPDARAVLDWLKSPFVLADQPGHAARVARLERSLRRIGRSSGWQTLWQAARMADARTFQADGHAVHEGDAAAAEAHRGTAGGGAMSSEAGGINASGINASGIAAGGLKASELKAGNAVDGATPAEDDADADADADAGARRLGPTQHLVARLQAQARRWNRAQLPLEEWSALLDGVLDEFGLRRLLADDEAGRQLLHALAMTAAGGSVRLSFSEYRALLTQQLETAAFREEPARAAVRVTILPLSGARMRRFDGVVMVGCDDRQLPATPQDALFFSDRLRRELGLPDRAARHAQQARDLAELLINNARVVCTWQTLGSRGEPLRLSGWLLRLQAQQERNERQAAGSGGPEDHATPRWIETARAALPLREAAHAPQEAPAPAAPALVPLRLSAHAYKRLRNCPYQFFAARMLGLSELELADDELDRRDIGEWLHAILHDYHRALDADGIDVAALGRAERAALLREVSARRFDGAIAEDGNAIRFWKRWGDRIDAYVDWQASCEESGWRWHDGELEIEQSLLLEDGTRIVLHGRLDRIDRHADGREAIRDYKLKRNASLKDLLKDSSEDCQLPFYALLRGIGLDDGVDAGEGAEAATESAAAGRDPCVVGYVGLDDAPVDFLELTDAVAHSRALARQIRIDLQRLLRGETLRALGDERACRWCDARGLCRNGHWQEGRE